MPPNDYWAYLSRGALHWPTRACSAGFPATDPQKEGFVTVCMGLSIWGGTEKKKEKGIIKKHLHKWF